jgi:hypothetical protein
MNIQNIANIVNTLMAMIAGVIIASMMVTFAYQICGIWLAIPVVFIAADVGQIVFMALKTIYSFKTFAYQFGQYNGNP